MRFFGEEMLPACRRGGSRARAAIRLVAVVTAISAVPGCRSADQTVAAPAGRPDAGDKAPTARPALAAPSVRPSEPTVVYGEKCPDCCSLSPADFGLGSPGELEVLEKLINEGKRSHTGERCSMPRTYYAMDHVRDLAVKNQDMGAAKLIIYADTPGGVDLGGGEQSEMLGDTYLIPVLMEYRELDKLVPPSMHQRVADVVCNAYFRGGEPPVEWGVLVRSVEAKKATALAHAIESTCDRLAREDDQPEE